MNNVCLKKLIPFANFSAKERNRYEKEKCLSWILLEGLGELLLTLLCLRIGMLVVSLFGVDVTSDTVGYDLLCLLGVVIFFAVFGAICAIIHLIKKTRNG